MLEITAHDQRKFVNASAVLRFGIRTFPLTLWIDSEDSTGYLKLTVPDAIESL